MVVERRGERVTLGWHLRTRRGRGAPGRRSSHGANPAAVSISFDAETSWTL